VLGPVGAIAGVLWLATAYGLTGRWGWTAPDPTLFDDGLAPWVVLAVAATGVDLVLLLLPDVLLGRLVRPWRGRRAVAGGVHLAVAAGLAMAYLGGWT
jgi:hypothetical protein